jgi:protein-S-isoprenylcysteine O-methyltransferase Ste14
MTTLFVGGAIALLGLAFRAWSAGHIRKNDALATSGPYAHTRNPLYLGSFVLGLGFTIASGRPWLGLLFAALFLGIYLPVMRVEASTLSQLFGDDYARYAAAVPLFIPRITAYRDPKTVGVKFDPGLYLRYREYQAALGLALAWILLAVLSFIR